MKRFGVALFGLGLLLSSLPSCEQWVSTACLKDDIEAMQETEQDVTMSAVTAADYLGTLPLASISCPDAGEEIKAEHVRAPVAAFLAECDDIRTGAGGLDDKYDKVGGLITGPVTVTPAAANATALTATGKGTGYAAELFGSASTGAARFVAGAGSNAFALSLAGDGTGSALVATGGANDGPGAEISTGGVITATDPKMALYISGLVKFDGTPPNADADPGFDNAVGKQNIVTSSAILESDGVGGFTVRNNKGFNVLSWSGDAVGVVTVNFKRNLPGSDYRINVFANDGYRWGWNGVQNVNNYQFLLKVYNTGATIDLTTTAVTIHVSTIGF